MTTLKELVEEREVTHGPYHRTATIAQALKSVFEYHTPLRMELLTPDNVARFHETAREKFVLVSVLRESSSMILQKVARVLSSDKGYSECPDHFRDIGGYAELAADTLFKYRGTPLAVEKVSWTDLYHRYVKMAERATGRSLKNFKAEGPVWWVFLYMSMVTVKPMEHLSWGALAGMMENPSDEW